MESGEFLDLTITSYSNKFGAEKINNSINFGIQTPIDKYTQELEMINSNTKDDKSEKRELRYKFFENCIKEIDEFPDLPNYLEVFFKIMICWLNGGGDKPPQIDENGDYYINYFEFNYNQFNSQKLIATVAGGNIIIIFGKLLNDIITSIINNIGIDLKRVEDPSILQKYVDEKFMEIYNNLTKTNKDIINFMEKNKITKNQFFLNLLLRLRYTSSLYDNIIEISKSNYSDFDYSLLPNFYEPFYSKKQIPSLINKLESLIKTDSKLYQGFGLFRIKSYVNCNDDLILDKKSKQKLKNSCKKILPPEVFEKLYPQAINKSDLDNPTLNNDNEDSINCKEFIKFLLDQKDIIKKSTTANINLVKNYFSEKLKSIWEYREVKTQEQIELEAVIFYINYTSFKINNYIRKWELGEDLNKFSKYTYVNKTTKEKFEFKNIRNLDYQDIVYSFLNLENIYVSNYSFLLRLVGGIFENFLNQDDNIFGINKSFSEELLDVFIEEKNKLTSNKCKIDPILLTFVFNKKLKSTSLNYLIKEHVLKALQKVMYSKKGFPDGFNIVINTIVSDNLDEETNINLEDLNIDVIGDLISELDILKEKEKELPKNTVDLKRTERLTSVAPYKKRGGKKYTKKRVVKTKKTKNDKLKQIKKINITKKPKNNKIKKIKKINITKKPKKNKIK